MRVTRFQDATSPRFLFRPSHQSMQRLFAAAIVLTALVSKLEMTKAAEQRTLRAGAAQVDITPPLGEMIVGGFVPFPADRIHDPLFAKCIALDAGQNQVAIVVCDNLGIRREEFDEAKAKHQKILRF